MTRKTLIIILLFSFVLSACGSNVETIQPTSTSVSTLQATSTFTPEPTTTNTLIPTATPFQYTSCLDPQLMEEIKVGFTEKFEMTLDEYVDKIADLGKYSRFFSYSSNESQADYLLLGGSEISLANLNAADESDKAFCLYFVDDSDTSIIFPVVLAYTYKSIFYLTSPIGNNTGDKSGLSHFTSIDELREWWTKSPDRLEVGDVLLIRYHFYKGISSPEQIEKLEHSKIPENISQFLTILNNDYLQRISGIIDPLTASQELRQEEGDIGLFVQVIILQQRNPLGE